MGKIADEYFKLDPWKIIEEGYDPKRNLVSESVFSLGNEYMGVRGYCEERVSCQSLIGSYFNGVYEFARELKDTAYKGIVKRTHFMINTVDWLYSKITLDEETLDIASCDIENFKRVLDMRDATLTREFDWNLKSGKKVHLKFLRFLSMNKPWQGYQKIEITPLNFEGKITVETGLDFSIIHKSSNFCFWNEIKKSAKEDFAAILCKTPVTGIRLFSGFNAICDSQIEKFSVEREKYIGLVYKIRLSNKKTSTFIKKVTNVVCKNKTINDDEVFNKSVEKCSQIEDVDTAYSQQKKYWKDIWEKYDIEIGNDLKRQQGIRFCIFQLQQTYQGFDPMDNIGAKGLTGEAYNGHTFWDTETYCLPFFLFNNVKAAKNLLEYRYITLENAKKRAHDLDCDGACFPVATINGDEACDLWQHASLQFQPSTGVAYGIMHYYNNTHDDKFLFGHGAEMLVEISRFLKCRGAWNSSHKTFGFYGVMGPDEFHMMVNNNFYTNAMAKKTFEYTVETLNKLKSENPTKYKLLVKKVGLNDNELSEFSKCAKDMKIPYDSKTGVYEQHDGYFDLPHINVNEIPIKDFPLYNNWSYDRIYRTDMIKQPDVLMIIFLFNSSFSADEKLKNYDYYEPRTIHESSLSPSIHSVLASELGKKEEAFRFFDFATRMDIDNYNRNTGEGLHTTSLAAAWINIVYGFGGVRSDGETLKMNPTIPDAWDHYSFRITYFGVTLCITITKTNIEIEPLLSDKTITINIYGKDYLIGKSNLNISTAIR